MPIYQPQVRGVQLSEALAQAAAIAPITYAKLSTFELSHPSLSAPVRLVHNHEAITATLEDSAPFDAGSAVEFLAASIVIVPPEESDTAASPEITLTIGNVAGLASDALKVARGSLDSWLLIERIYTSNDLSGPAVMPPMRLEVTKVVVGDINAQVTASFGDPVNTAIPSLTFKLEEYPGLYER